MAGAEGFEPSTKVLETFAQPQYLVFGIEWIIPHIDEKNKTVICSLSEHLLFFFRVANRTYYAMKRNAFLTGNEDLATWVVALT